MREWLENLSRMVFPGQGPLLRHFWALWRNGGRVNLDKEPLGLYWLRGRGKIHHTSMALERSVLIISSIGFFLAIKKLVGGMRISAHPCLLENALIFLIYFSKKSGENGGLIPPFKIPGLSQSTCTGASSSTFLSFLSLFLGNWDGVACSLHWELCQGRKHLS